MKKNTHFIGSSKYDLNSFPEDVRREFGYAIFLAQTGDRALNATPMVGFGGANVLEIRTDGNSTTYRCVYTVRFEKAVYVLHAFVKKSKSGIATPAKELDLIRSRLKRAQEHYKEKYEASAKEKQRVGKHE